MQLHGCELLSVSVCVSVSVCMCVCVCACAHALVSASARLTMSRRRGCASVRDKRVRQHGTQGKGLPPKGGSRVCLEHSTESGSADRHSWSAELFARAEISTQKRMHWDT